MCLGWVGSRVASRRGVVMVVYRWRGGVSRMGGVTGCV